MIEIPVEFDVGRPPSDAFALVDDIVENARVEQPLCGGQAEASKGMPITHAIDTHVHADHRLGGPALAKKVGAKCCLHESADVAFSVEPLRDGQEAELGNARVKVLHTPGHTPETVCQPPGEAALPPGRSRVEPGPPLRISLRRRDERQAVEHERLRVALEPPALENP